MKRFKVKATQIIIKDHELTIICSDAEQARKHVENMFASINIKEIKEVNKDE